MIARRPSHRPTLADVAAVAGVSPKTVSRVVNGEPHVSATLAGRVRRALDDLDYRPDRRARDLASGPGSALVGFVLVDASNPFFAAVSRGLDDVLHEAGYLVISASTDADPAREQVLVGAYAELRVQGLVVAAAEGHDDTLRREIEHGTPVVCIDRLLPDVDCDTVVADNRPASRRAVRRLIDRGHSRIAHVGGNPDIWTATERHRGYREAHHERGLAIEPHLEVVGVHDAEAAAAAVRELLEHARPPTAIFTAQDQITVGAVTSLRAGGHQHDVALVGFDDIPMGEHLDPAVAVVAQDPYEMGRCAASRLLERLGSPPRTEPTTSVVETTLIPRASADVAPPGIDARAAPGG